MRNGDPGGTKVLRDFKIQDGDDREIREKMTAKLLTPDRVLEPTLPALLVLLDVPEDNAAWRALDPGQRRQRTLDAVKRLLLREAREQPADGRISGRDGRRERDEAKVAERIDDRLAFAVLESALK